MRVGLILVLSMSLSAVIACAATQARSGAEDEDRLAAALAGRTAGEAQNCVSIMGGQALRVIDDRTLLFEEGRTYWVNRLETPCPGMRPNDALIIEPTGNQYCRGDQIRSLDPASRIAGPVCRLEAFIPYRLQDPSR